MSLLSLPIFCMAIFCTWISYLPAFSRVCLFSPSKNSLTELKRAVFLGHPTSWKWLNLGRLTLIRSKVLTNRKQTNKQTNLTLQTQKVKNHDQIAWNWKPQPTFLESFQWRSHWWSKNIAKNWQRRDKTRKKRQKSGRLFHFAPPDR